MIRDTVVVDLDGTLSDGRARYHLVKGKHRDYDAFHARLEEDPVNYWCLSILEAYMRYNAAMHDLYAGVGAFRLVLVSARPAVAREATYRWLRKHVVPHDELHLLRKDGDSTPDHELKRAWVRAYGKERILFCIDDRQKVVDMWREEGLTCLQCAAWKDDKENKNA